MSAASASKLDIWIDDEGVWVHQLPPEMRAPWKFLRDAEKHGFLRADTTDVGPGEALVTMTFQNGTAVYRLAHRTEPEDLWSGPLVSWEPKA